MPLCEICKNCSQILQPGDRHSYCSECRLKKLGDDPCVKGKSCKKCDSFAKAIEEERKKQKLVDDSLLDDEPHTASSAACGSSLDSTLKLLSSQIATLTSRVANIERPPNTSSRAMISGGVNAATASNSDSQDLPEAGEVESDIDDKPEETVNDPSYVEMLQAVKGILDLADPEVDCLQPPSAFRQGQTFKSTKRQLSAFPPEENVQSMWSYRHQLAVGKDAFGHSSHAPLHTGSFLQYSKITMDHYESVPQLTPLKAPQVPEGFYNLYKDRSPAVVSIPWKQHKKNECALRENIQVLEKVVYFKRAISELNKSIKGLVDSAKHPSANVGDMLDNATTRLSMQARIVGSVELALESVLNQTMILGVWAWLGLEF